MGERFEVLVGPVAHGGHCVARLEPEPGPGPERGRVVFVRHAIPGERVTVLITEGTEGDGFWRADAVEVHEASSDRVVPPCPYAGPDACGGCDFQHVSLDRQRSLKAEVVAEQLRRLGHLDLAGTGLEVAVEAVPGDQDGLRWRTRQQYVELPDGARALRKHRSHDLVEVDDCLIAGATASHVVHAAGIQHAFEVADDGFWQVHPGAPTVLVETVLDLLAAQPGESVLDLYAGVGLFARFLADVVGDTGAVTLVEGDPGATDCATRNVPGAAVLTGDVAKVLTADPDAPAAVDLVVLDPPREGARLRVVEQIVARAPRAVAYVACDPAALARDVALFADAGYTLRSIRAFDQFPMTQHIECVALLTR